MTIQAAIQTVLDKHDLTAAQMRNVMQIILEGRATDAQIAGFLIALRCKGESIAEMVAAVEVMRGLSSAINVQGPHLVDTCGTGGDGAHTFNISTTCAFIVAAAGGQVAKHGNRSVSSRCGSADVLEAAGVNLDLSAEQVARCIETVGIGFLFAPKHHEAMRHTVGPRKELGVRTVFNLLGPLCNPASAPNQLIGVFARHWLEPLARVLQQTGSQHVLLVHADDGLDEISIASPSTVTELKHGHITTYTITPEQFGLPRATLSELAVDGVESSLNRLLSVLDNVPGAARDIALLNAGAAIYAANLTDSLAEGVSQAQRALATGDARAKFDAFVSFSNQCP